jgi:hypothetical protein
VTRYLSKTVATWTALVGGTLVLHRFYLRGFGDWLGWLHVVPTSLGLVGVERMRELGQDDRLAWLLTPLLGLMISQAMLHAIVYALTPDAKWDARRNSGRPGPPTTWGPVLGAAVALFLGASVAMSTAAFGLQRFFEWQLEGPQETQRSSINPR